MIDLLSASCRVAFAALIHDLSKFSQRAKLPISRDELDAQTPSNITFHFQIT